ncbi:MAG: hypothetical protein J6A01_07405 [Proteobacteria bacterium]|nr:hypothetical protein [Pseudomonadota bacterium]
MKTKLFALCLLGIFTLQACDENDERMVVDSKGRICKSDDGHWTDCRPETYRSKCNNGKAVVCGNAYTNFEVFEFDCDCKMVDGKATCGECEPGKLDTSIEGKTRICNPAGLWEILPYPLEHPDDMQPCDPATYRAKCDGNTALECNELTGRIAASKCNPNIYSANTCVEVDDKLEETEYNQYTQLCESTVHRAYCSYCKPGEVADTGTVCLDGKSRNAAPVKCSEFGFWIDKESGDIPKYDDCDTACYKGQCLGKLVRCTSDAEDGHVCYTEDSMVMNRLYCDIYGKWYNNDSPLDIQYCAKGCKDNVCMI